MNNQQERNSNSYDNNTYHFSYTDPTAQSYRVDETKRTHNPKGGVGKVIALCLACALVGGCVGGGVTSFVVGGTSESNAVIYESDRTVSAVETLAVTGTNGMTVSQVYAANVSSTVGITVDVTTNFFGMTTTSAASGSGFIITEDGYIVTNYHVIEGGSAIRVTLSDNTSYSAEVVGYDEDHDLAVLKVDPGEDTLTPVVLGSSDGLNVGDTVIAIGNPLGELTFSCTSGIVSALNRSVTVDNGGTTMTLLQTDCAINSGNSGGALFNSYGEVIGITNAKYSSSSSSSDVSIDNIGFAIPIDQVKDLIVEIMETGTVAKPYLGITVVTVSETDAQRYNMAVGVYVNSVTEDSCAAKAGLQTGDVITAFNGTAVTTVEELNSQKAQYSPGETVTITVVRNGETVELSVVLDRAPESTVEDSSNQTQSGSSYSGSASDPWSYYYGYGNGINPYGSNPYGSGQY